MGDFVPRNVLIVLSTDGGVTWKSPHLLGVSSDQSGGVAGDSPIVQVVDLAADVMQATDTFWLNGSTRAIHVAWRAAGGLFYSFVEFDRATEDLIPHPFSFGGDRQKIDASVMNPPGTPVPNVNEMALVAVDQAPTLSSVLFIFPQTLVEGNGCSGGSTRNPITQTWHFMSTEAFGSSNWPLAPIDFVVPNWPSCVGGIDTGVAGNPPVYRNRARASAVFRTYNDTIDFAINRPRPGDPYSSSEIAVVEYHYANASRQSLAFSSVPVEGPINPERYQTDQWLPTLSRNGDGRWVHLSWVDVVDSPTTAAARNQPYGIYGSTYQNNALVAPTRAFPSLPYLMADMFSDFDLGLWNASILVDDTTHSFVDVLSDGRTPTPMPPPVSGIFSVENRP